MSLSIPKEQKHGVETPVMLPFYQYVKLSPVGSASDWTINGDTYTQEIKFELSGDNIINLSKSYIQYDLVIRTTPIDKTVKGWTGDKASDKDSYPNFIKGLKEGFGLASFRICNQTGTDLVRVDDSYEPYRIFMDEIVRKRPDQYYQANYYDGIQLKWNDNVKDKVVQDEAEFQIPWNNNNIISNSDGDRYTYDNEPEFRLHVKIPLGRFYNTFAAMKSDVFFAERMYICIKFQTIDKFGPFKSYALKGAYKTVGDTLDNTCTFSTAEVVENNIKIENMRFYAYYNKDSQCNNNTKNYCLSKPIQFNDFRCHQVSYSSPNGIFNYSFTLNSSNGPFLRFIIYRPWDEDDSKWLRIPENAQFRWMINDFVHQPDYALMQYYDSYMMVQDYFKDSWYDVFRQDKSFNEKFFEILNFGSRDLDNIKNQAGRPLAADLKITFEISCPGDPAFTTHRICHKFYIITGRLCTINGSGIVSVV